MKLIVLTALVLLAGLTPARSQIPDHDQVGNPVTCHTTGRVQNKSFRFSVLVPHGLRGCDPDRHGILIPLGKRTEPRVVGCGGLDNSSDTTSLQESVDRFVNSVLRDARVYPEAVLVRRASTTLGGIAALRLVFTYHDPRSRREMVFDDVEALSRSRWPGRDAALYSYEVWLKTPSAQYDTDKKVFENVLSNWRYEGSK